MLKASLAMALGLVALDNQVVEARVSWGSECPEYSNVENFDPARFNGKWYEVVRDN